MEKRIRRRGEGRERGIKEEGKEEASVMEKEKKARRVRGKYKVKRGGKES